MEGITTCKALGLKNIPHIGIYSFNYEWLGIISYFKSIGNEDWDQIVPNTAKSAVAKLLNDHKMRVNETSYLTVNYTSTMLKQKHWNNMNQKWVRFNMVYHPFFMSDLEPGIEEEKKFIMASIYTEDSLMYGIKRSNSSPIPINSEDLFLAHNWVELHVHSADENDPNAIAVSPNNAAFLLDMTCPIVTFYSVAIEKLDKKNKCNILVTYHCIIDELAVSNLTMGSILNTNEL